MYNIKQYIWSSHDGCTSTNFSDPFECDNSALQKPYGSQCLLLLIIMGVGKWSLCCIAPSVVTRLVVLLGHWRNHSCVLCVGVKLIVNIIYHAASCSHIEQTVTFLSPRDWPKWIPLIIMTHVCFFRVHAPLTAESQVTIWAIPSKKDSPTQFRFENWIFTT